MTTADLQDYANYFSFLRDEKHMSLVTFRANGNAVPTPIWFAEVDSALYVRTASHFKKLERIANNPRVEVAPCTANGEVTGESVPARARILDPNDPVVAGADAALEARYTLERPAMTRLLQESGWSGVYVEIRPPIRRDR